MYNVLPETENRSLEAIETHFSDDSKKITDWHIPKHVKKQSISNTEMKDVYVSQGMETII